MGSTDPRRGGTAACNDINRLVRCPTPAASLLLEGSTTTTDVRDRTALAGEALADVRDLDGVREPDEGARARATKLSLPDLRGSQGLDPGAPRPWRSAFLTA